MKLEIKDDEHEDVLVDIVSVVLQALQANTDSHYVVINNDDGTCLKAGVNAEGLWIAKYTDDDIEVE